jgi:hypothetical protein
MLNRRAVLTATICILLTGCASFGPLGTPAFEPTLRRDIPNIVGKLTYQSPASLLYGIDGYDLWANATVNWPIFAQGRVIVLEGIVVLSEQKLYFVKWFGERYQLLWKLDYKKITSVEIRSVLLGHRIVIKFDEEPYVTSLDIATDSGQRIDAEKTVTVCRLIARGSGRDCKLPQ